MSSRLILAILAGLLTGVLAFYANLTCFSLFPAVLVAAFIIRPAGPRQAALLGALLAALSMLALMLFRCAPDLTAMFAETYGRSPGVRSSRYASPPAA